MSFKIDLGLNDHTTKDTTVDVVAASEAMSTAEMSLVKCETEKAIIVAAAENLERGVQLSQAIAEKTQDEGVALAVGNEALVSSLRMLGQATAGESLTAGSESFSAGVEASEGMLKKMLDKAKEYGKKVWEFIRNLLAKIVKWVKALIGKGDDTATQLKELLKKAKDDKRTNLNVDEFEGAVAERLIKNVKYMALRQGDKGIDSGVIKDNVAAIQKLIDAADRSKDIVNFETGLLKKVNSLITTVADATNILTIKNAIIEVMPKLLKEANDQFDALLSNDDIDTIKAEFDDEQIKIVTILGNDCDTLTVLVTYQDAEAEDINKFFAKGIDKLKGAEAIALAKKVVDTVKVKVIKITPEYSEVKDYAGDLKPISHTDATGLVKTLTDLTKQAEKLARKADKDADSATKSVSKAVDDIESGLSSDSQAPGLKTDVIQLFRAIISVNEKIIQEDLKARASLIRAAVRPKWGDIVKESVRLYEK